MAISAAGMVIVPIYPTNSPEECLWVVGNSGARAVVAEDATQLGKIEQVRGELPELRHTIGIESGGGETTVDELRARGKDGDREELRRRQSAVQPDDAWIFIYTSGTTGPPKGVVLTHGNAATIGTIVEGLDFIRPDDLSYLYLPLAHVFAQTVQIGSFEAGTAIVYFSGDTKQIIPELTETHPTYLPSVPRIFEKLYSMATAQVAKGSPEEREQFFAAIKVGVRVRELERRGEPVPEELREPFAQSEEKIFAPVRGLFGAKVRQAVSGAAPIAPEILEFFYACGIPVLEGYGLTETTGVATVNTPTDIKIGTVGKPVPGCEGPDRRGGRRDPPARDEHLSRVLAEPRGDRRGPDRRRLVPHRRPRRARRRGLPQDHRPQEGHHHHRRRQEPDAGQPGERPQAVAVGLAGRHARRPPSLPRRARHAGRGGDRAVGAGARAAHRPGGPWPPRPRSAR
jgi:long-chain acyl-CoA synthetase